MKHRPAPMPQTRGGRMIAFIETYCRQPEGEENVGELLVLEDFQKRFILETYDNPFHTHTAILSTAKKNGKTAGIAGIALGHIAGPEALLNSQVACGAMSKDQAAILFDYMVQMIMLEPALKARVMIKASQKRLVGIKKGVRFRALANEGNTVHGQSPALVILDELGQVEGPTDPFVNGLVNAQGAYEHGMTIAISTQAASDADLLSTWIDAQEATPDPRVVCHVYAAPDECALDDRKAWAAANPALGKFRSIPDMERLCSLAQNIAANAPDFRNFNLNQRVDRVAPFVTREVWERNGATPAPVDDRPVYLGLDLSSVQDLTSCVAVTDDFDVHVFAWLPKEGLRAKARHDRVPYDVWEKQGLLMTTPGSAIEYRFVAAWLRGFFDNHPNVKAVGFDRALMRFLRPWLVEEGFSEQELERFIDFGQGWKSMTPAIRELEVQLANGAMRHGRNPLLTMACRNVRVIGDSGARKFDKHKSRGRIDPMIALVNAIGVMPLDATEDEGDLDGFLSNPAGSA